MTGPCCARPLPKAGASILPAVLVALLPKCPLCLAAWLTVATGISFSPAGATWLRAGLVLLSAVAIALVVRRKTQGRVFSASSSAFSAPPR